MVIIPHGHKNDRFLVHHMRIPLILINLKLRIHGKHWTNAMVSTRTLRNVKFQPVKTGFANENTGNL